MTLPKPAFRRDFVAESARFTRFRGSRARKSARFTMFSRMHIRKTTRFTMFSRARPRKTTRFTIFSRARSRKPRVECPGPHGQHLRSYACCSTGCRPFSKFNFFRVSGKYPGAQHLAENVAKRTVFYDRAQENIEKRVASRAQGLENHAFYHVFWAAFARKGKHRQTHGFP